MVLTTDSDEGEEVISYTQSLTIIDTTTDDYTDSSTSDYTTESFETTEETREFYRQFSFYSPSLNTGYKIV